MVGGRRWSARQWRRSVPSPATAGCGRERERVWRVPGVVASPLAGADGEARTEATGRGRCPRVPVVVAMHALASLGVVGTSRSRRCGAPPRPGRVWARPVKQGGAGGQGWRG